MKAHIVKPAQENDACEYSVSLREGVIYGGMPYKLDNATGRIHYKGDYEAICDPDTREFELTHLNISEASFIEILSNGKHRTRAMEVADGVAEALQAAATKQAIELINENQEYLLDNHHDFEVDLRNSLERMLFANHGVSGRTEITKNEDEMDKVQDSDYLGDTLVIEFDADYKIEFYDETKEDILMKDCVVTSFTAKHFKHDTDYTLEVPDMEFTEEEAEDMKRRIVLAIEDNFTDIEYTVTEALGGFPVE